MKRKIITIIMLIGTIFPMIILSGCASCSREFKSFQSNISGGMNRIVTIYDYNGNILRTYEGKIDITDSENEIMFDLNGKRYVIHGGIAVVEEK